MHHGTHFGEGILATRIFLMQVSVFPPLLWIKKCNVCILLCNCYVMPSHSLIEIQAEFLQIYFNE